MTIVKDLNIKLQIIKYAINIEQGKSNHFIWTEKTVHCLLNFPIYMWEVQQIERK